MPTFRFIVKCLKNGQTLYLEGENGFTFTTRKPHAKQYLFRDAALDMAKRVMANKKLGVKKATAEKVGLGKELTYVDY